MRVGSLVAKGGLISSVNFGLVLKRLKVASFDEVFVIWFNPSWTLNGRNIKRWEITSDIRVIST